MIWLLGPVRAVYAELNHVEPEGKRTDARFSVSLTHTGGVRSSVSASKLNHIEDRELRAYGSAGSYVARGTDVQAQAIFAGLRPVDEGSSWGYDAPERWGTLNTADGSRPVPSEQGAYQHYYSQFAAALRGDAAFPVPARRRPHPARRQRRMAAAHPPHPPPRPRGRPAARPRYLPLRVGELGPRVPEQVLAVGQDVPGGEVNGQVSALLRSHPPDHRRRDGDAVAAPGRVGGHARVIDEVRRQVGVTFVEERARY